MPVKIGKTLDRPNPQAGERSRLATSSAAIPPGPPARGRLRPPRLLTYIDAVARHGSIRKAADALNVASSALNRQILDLESDLGSTLFERLPRGVRVTAAGEIFLAYARQAISELKAVASQVEQLRGLVRGRVNVAAVDSVAGELLPSAISEFQADHPNVRFNVQIGAPDELVSALVADQADLILTHYPPPRKHAVIAAAAKQVVCAHMAPDHPLAGRAELRLRDCISYPLALADSTLSLRMLIEQLLAESSFDLDPQVVSNSFEVMQAFARINRGIYFQFRKPSAGPIRSGDMVAVPLIDAPLLQAKLFLATRRGRVLPIAAAAFVEQFEESWRED
jgi:DNA-binding transcriptional LysR family regulator